MAGTFSSATPMPPPSFDPIQETSITWAALLAPCYSGIVQHDPLEPTKVIGDLAQKWDMSSDGTIYTFDLHNNVRWHDGTPFTSEDARFSLELVRKPPQGIVSPRKESLRPIDKIEAPDKDTLKITLQHPSASFLVSLSDSRMLVVPKHVFEAKGNMRRDAVGTGPYKFKSHNAGVSFSVVKNSGYFIKGSPYLDEITRFIIRDTTTRFAALRTQRVQVTAFGSYGLTPYQSEIIRKEMSDRIDVQRFPGLAYPAFCMPFNKSPWNDMRVRRAVEMTIDRQKVIRVAAEGVGDIGAFMPAGAWSLPEAELTKMPGYRQPKDADIAEAKRLMADTGYAQGFKTTITTVSGSLPREKAAMSLREQLAQIGIDLAIKMVDSTAQWDVLYKRDFDSVLISGTASYDDPDQVFANYITGVLTNYGDFSDENIDKWYAEQARTLDPEKRKQIVLEMQRRMHELIPVSILYWFVFELGSWKEVKDLKPGIGLYNNLKFQNVWLAK